MSVLVIGSGGFLGKLLCRTLAERGCEVVTASHGSQADIALDLGEDPGAALAKVPAGVRHAVLCASITSIDRCFLEPEATRLFNVVHSGRLLDGLMERGVSTVFCSSDLVFAGDRGGYDEADETAPIAEYGRHKKAIEDRLLAAGDGAVVRMGKLFLPGPVDRSPVRGLVQSLRAGQRVKAARDQTITPTRADEAAGAIADIIEGRGRGIFHVAPPPAGWMTRLSLAQAIAERLDRADLVEACALADLPVAEPRPRDTTLRTRRYAELCGKVLTPFAEHLDAVLTNP